MLVLGSVATAIVLLLTGCDGPPIIFDVAAGYSGPVVVVFDDPKGQDTNHVLIDEHGLAFVRQKARSSSFKVLQGGKELSSYPPGNGEVQYAYFTSGAPSLWCVSQSTPSRFGSMDIVSFAVGKNIDLNAENAAMKLFSTTVMDKYMEHRGRGEEYQRAIKEDPACDRLRPFVLH